MPIATQIIHRNKKESSRSTKYFQGNLLKFVVETIDTEMPN